MPRIIESPDEFVEQAIAVEDNSRSQRTVQLEDPEDFRPQASPVDLSRGGGEGAGKIAALQALSGALSAGSRSLSTAAYFGRQVKADTIEREKDLVGDAISERELIDSAPEGPIKTFFRGLNPFIGQGRREQFGENLRIRLSGAFETALLEENKRRLERGEPVIEGRDAVHAWAQDYYNEGMSDHINGQDEDFQRGFREGLADDLNAISLREEISYRKRVVDETLDSGGQLTRELSSATIDDTSGALAPDAVSDGMIEWVKTMSSIGMGTYDELAGPIIDDGITYLKSLVRRGQWADLDGKTLRKLEDQYLRVAEDDGKNRAIVTDGFDSIQTEIDQAQTRAAAQAEIEEEAAIEDAERAVLRAALSGDQQALSEAQLRHAGLTNATKAKNLRDSALEVARTSTGATANSVAHDWLISWIDQMGPTVSELVAKRDQIIADNGVAFTADELDEHILIQSRSKQRGKVRKDPTFKAEHGRLIAEFKLSGYDPDEFDALLDANQVTQGQRDLKDAFDEIDRAFVRKLTDFADNFKGGPEAAFRSPEWPRVVAKAVEDAKEQVRAADPSPEDSATNDAARATVDLLREAVVNNDLAEVPDDQKTAAIVAVTNLNAVDHVIKSGAYPETAQPDNTFLNSQAALHLNGMLDAETEYIKQREILQTQISGLQTALRGVSATVDPEASPRDNAGKLSQVNAISERMAVLEDALKAVNTNIAALNEPAGDTEVAAN